MAGILAYSFWGVFPLYLKAVSATPPLELLSHRVAWSLLLLLILVFRAGQATEDGAFTLETDANVGAGAIAPAVRIDTLVYGPLTVDEARHLIYARRADASPAQKSRSSTSPSPPARCGTPSSSWARAWPLRPWRPA